MTDESLSTAASTGSMSPTTGVGTTEMCAVDENEGSTDFTVAVTRSWSPGSSSLTSAIGRLGCEPPNRLETCTFCVPDNRTFPVFSTVYDTVTLPLPNGIDEPW